ncbi:MAG TPA: hypothetical protein VF210_08040 [Pseudomonadales bacterium]
MIAPLGTSTAALRTADACGAAISALRRFHRVGVGRLLAAGCLLALTACGGSSGSGGGLLGGDQGPDPVVVDFSLAYVKRPLLTDEDGNLITRNVREPAAFWPGAELYLRDRASPSAADRLLTADVFPPDDMGNPPLYDVKDLAASYDGTQLLFAMRAPEDPNLDEDEQPTWNIWLYDHETDELRRVIESDIVAEEGDDIAPQFLPDGRIVFASTRQRHAKAILLDEGKPQFSALDEDRRSEAFALHVMNADGTDIHQITFNQSSDLDPTVLTDGRIAFSRWDNVAGIDRISLYTVNPDGTNLQLLYGAHSHDTGPGGSRVEFLDPQELPDGRLLVALRPFGDQARLGMLPVAVDTAAFVEHDQPTFSNEGLLFDAQELLIDGDLHLDDDTPALQGRYAQVSPLYDGTDRLLVAWSQCRLVDEVTDPDAPVYAPCTEENLADPLFVEADPLYGIWMHDVAQGTQQPIVPGEEGVAFSEAVILEARPAPAVILDGTPGVELDADLAGEAMGVLHIRSVYDFDGTASADLAALADPAVTTAADRPARFLRLVKAVSMPDDDIVELDGTAFGRSQAQLMREILGYAPIEPDGSVMVAVPANVAFWPEVLDADARRIGPRHQNWLQLRPGERFTCNGCHTPTSERPHGRLDAEAPSANPGAPMDGSPFPNTVPSLFADQGETMAEVWTRHAGAPRKPTVNPVYEDVWTDPAVRAPDATFSYSYAALSTPAPVDPGCATIYTALCRIVIDYETHVHPLWGVPRVDDMGVDHTCTACHAAVDAMGMAMVPAAQLDLGDGPSPDEAAHFKSYRELLFNDNRQILDNGALVDELVQATDGNGDPLFQTDGNGELILDANGDPIPVLVPIVQTPPLSVAGANAIGSSRFFSRFQPGGSHEGWLTPAELRLISEWIDIGGQYYNNPFNVPQ